MSFRRRWCDSEIGARGEVILSPEPAILSALTVMSGRWCEFEIGARNEREHRRGLLLVYCCGDAVTYVTGCFLICCYSLAETIVTTLIIPLVNGSSMVCIGYKRPTERAHGP